MGVEWNPADPGTHPSVQRLTTAEIVDRLERAVASLEEDAGEYADHPDRALVRELLDGHRRSIDQYRSALRARGEVV